MTAIRKILNIVLKTLAGILAFLAIYFSSAYILSRLSFDKEPPIPAAITIYIKTNGVHTDVVVPTRTSMTDWGTILNYGFRQAVDSTWPYVGIGWGDKGFYLNTPNWADLKFATAFKAAFWLSSSAMHVTFYKNITEGEAVRRIQLSEGQYKRLVEYINTSFKHNIEGRPEHIETTANYGNSDAFYEATGKYNLFYTCNTWANYALKACGQKCCIWTIFDTGIFMKYAAVPRQ